MGWLDFFFDSGNSGSGRSKKTRKRALLMRNREKGKAGERYVAFLLRLAGHDVEKAHKGYDFRVRYRDPLTGRVVGTEKLEVKTGPKARLSRRQRKEKRGSRRYKVIRVEDSWLLDAF